MDIYILKHEIRYEVIRWKAKDILNGFVNYRGFKIHFNDYLLGDSITKIDAIAWINGIRYNEITMVYNFTKDNKPVNNRFQNLIVDILGQMPFLLYERKYMKICKRINSIERAFNNPDENLLIILNKLFNSSLGRLNQVISDISVLEYLIDNVSILSEKKFNMEIDQIRYRLGDMTNKKYLQYQDKVLKLLNIIDKDVLDFDALEKLRVELFEILETETLNFMKENNLFPLPYKYLPRNIYGQGIIDMATKAINYISNMLPSSDKNATEIEPDEKHGVLILPNGKVGRANSMGPGTNLIKRLKRGDKPRTEMDELSRAHDIRYDLSQNQKDIEEADEIFIKGAKKIRKNKLDNTINTYAGQIPIQAKLYAERKGLVKPTFKQINKFEKDDEKLLRDTLKTAIMKGYGTGRNKISMSKKDLLKEHKHLIKVLKSGSKKEQVKEATDQQHEMKKYL
jgi:hypothetical protein